MSRRTFEQWDEATATRLAQRLAHVPDAKASIAARLRGWFGKNATDERIDSVVAAVLPAKEG